MLFLETSYSSMTSSKSWLSGTFPHHPANHTSLGGIPHPPALLHLYPQNSAPAELLEVLFLLFPVCPQKPKSPKVGIFVLFMAKSHTQHLIETR